MLGFFPAEERFPPAYDTQEIIDAACVWFRERGFPYKETSLHGAMQEINELRAMKDPQLLHTQVGHRVADTYHKHRFHVRCDGKRSVVDIYNNDEWLRRAITKMATIRPGPLPDGYFSSLGWVSNGQQAANFRPGWMALMCRRYCPPGGTVLDTSTGFGGRLVGAIASGVVGYYIGIDPALPTCRGNWRMYRDLGQGKLRVRLIQKPAEDVDGSEFAGKCDCAVTSPPYWAKEHYTNEDTQSWKRYKTGDHWRDGFLTAMLRLQYRSLKPGGMNVVCVADVTVGDVRWPIVRWVEEIGASVGFEVLQRQPYPISRVPGRGKRPAREEVGCMLRKPEAKARQTL